VFLHVLLEESAQVTRPHQKAPAGELWMHPGLPQNGDVAVSHPTAAIARGRERRLVYTISGALLALGAPTGLLLMRLLRRRVVSWRTLSDEIAGDRATYAYVAGSTTMAFALFGGVLGHYADKLARLATTDPLTGLLNARAFDQRLRQEVARAARYGGPLALLMLDLDGLKAINDQQGHPAGDRALQSVASAIRSELREVDLAARLGGDEFGVLAPRTDYTAAMALGNRVRALAAERLAAALGRRCTVSVGAACLRPAETKTGTRGVLMESADTALYEAKRQGGNRVHVGA
jgi:diguanylate cyclase (GGDEF)-like protein